MLHLLLPCLFHNFCAVLSRVLPAANVQRGVKLSATCMIWSCRDRPLVPCPDLPSRDFLAQLRAYTGFRSKLDEAAPVRAFKSF